MPTPHKFSVYADGSSSPKKLLGIGWGWVVVYNGQPITAGYGGYPEGTNGISELMGAREGLRDLLRHPVYLAVQNDPWRTVELVSDSQVTLGLANGAFVPSKNVALAQHVRDICVKHRVTTRWVKGHSGDPWNEMCDKLSNQWRKDTYGETKKARRPKLVP